MLDKDRSTAIFRIFQESLTNVARHAHATSVEARFLHEPHRLIFQIVDNGTGFDPRVRKGRQVSRSDRHAGTRSLAGGEFKTEGKPGAGTTVTLTLPLRPLSATGKTTP